MIFDVRGVKFKIELVSNWVHEQYYQMQLLSAKIAGYVAKSGEIATSDSPKLEELEQLKVDIEAAQREIWQLRHDIVAELLKANGHTYDAEWWSKSTGMEDVNEFMLCCINKDRNPDKSSGVKKN